jgi:hypothetical protein
LLKLQNATGAVSAEVRAIKSEKLTREKKRAEEMTSLLKLEVEHVQNSASVMVENFYQNKDLQLETHDTQIHLER